MLSITLDTNTLFRTAEEGVHEVLVEEIVLIDGPSAAGRYACLASNRYGATKDVATLNYIGKFFLLIFMIK